MTSCMRAYLRLTGGGCLLLQVDVRKPNQLIYTNIVDCGKYMVERPRNKL